MSGAGLAALTSGPEENDGLYRRTTAAQGLFKGDRDILVRSFRHFGAPHKLRTVLRACSSVKAEDACALLLRDRMKE